MTSPIDLHCHSTISDGVLAPAAVVDRAYKNGVRVLALTDHDEVAGVPEAQRRAEELGMTFVPGVEVSVTWADRTVHIVGLGIDAADPVLQKRLKTLRDSRDGRAQKMAARLEDMGIEGAYDGAMAFVSNPALVSRTHFARFLVEAGHCKNMQEVFTRYLGDGGPANVPVRWTSLQEAVTWIQEAGGAAVIAHPGRYRFSEVEFDALFTSFKEFGGAAIEVITGSHTRQQFAQYADVARNYDFLASIGSDFHEPGSRRDLGELPALPSDLTPIWHDWTLPCLEFSR